MDNTLSSASSSPLLNAAEQGTSLSSNYAPISSVNKNLLNVSNQSENVTSSQAIKPISPSLATLKQDVNTLPTELSVLPSQKTCSPKVNPKLRISSSSSSTAASVNVCSQNASPLSVAHSTLDVAKTAPATKRRRKEVSNNIDSSPKEEINCDSKSKIRNEVTDILPSETSPFKKVNSKSDDESDELISLKTTKRMKIFVKNDDRLGDMIASLPSGTKLPKVKTTQQIIADLQVKKCTNLSPESLPPIDPLHCSDAEVSRTKSELLEKFLIDQCIRQEGSTDEFSDSTSGCESNFAPVPDVINEFSDIKTRISYPDPIEEEIKRILSELPPINPAEINLEDEDPISNRPVNVTSDDLTRLSEPWQHVNGLYDCSGEWRTWQECCEQKSSGKSLLIFPYVNID